MKADQIKIGERYKITFKDKYSRRIAKAIKISRMGDITLQFKNKSEVIYHATWLEKA
jgi:hypothetical protein